MLIDDPVFYFAAVPAVFLAAVSKGGFGGGLASLGVPMMSLVISVPQAAAIMLPILCLMDLIGVWAYRKTWDRRNLKIMVTGAAIGIMTGTATFHWFDGPTIKFLVGCIAISFTLHNWLKKAPRDEDAQPTAGKAYKGILWGTLSGFTSFLAHAGGPPANAFLLPQRMDKTLFVGTMIMFFTTVNWVKLLPYWWLGLLPVGNLAMSLVLAPLAPIGVLTGVWLHNRISPTWFYRLCYLFLFAAGLKLLYDGSVSLFS